ncbi:hypothetical protein KCU65_g9013, partial [Aureobasidium melanogenum]
MNDAKWIPVFVTAPVSEEVINTVLRHGQAACETDKDFINRWVLVQSPDQSTFYKPTEPPVQPFQSGFLEFSTKDLQDFVSSNFGEGGLGSTDPSDWIAHDAFRFKLMHAPHKIPPLPSGYRRKSTPSRKQMSASLGTRVSTVVDRLLVDLNEGEDLSEDDTHFLFQNLRDDAGNLVVSPGYPDLKSGMETSGGDQRKNREDSGYKPKPFSGAKALERYKTIQKTPRHAVADEYPPASAQEGGTGASLIGHDTHTVQGGRMRVMWDRLNKSATAQGQTAPFQGWVEPYNWLPGESTACNCKPNWPEHTYYNPYGKSMRL